MTTRRTYTIDERRPRPGDLVTLRGSLPIIRRVDYVIKDAGLTGDETFVILQGGHGQVPLDQVALVMVDESEYPPEIINWANNVGHAYCSMFNAAAEIQARIQTIDYVEVDQLKRRLPTAEKNRQKEIVKQLRELAAERAVAEDDLRDLKAARDRYRETVGSLADRVLGRSSNNNTDLVKEKITMKTITTIPAGICNVCGCEHDEHEVEGGYASLQGLCPRCLCLAHPEMGRPTRAMVSACKGAKVNRATLNAVRRAMQEEIEREQAKAHRRKREEAAKVAAKKKEQAKEGERSKKAKSKKPTKQATKKPAPVKGEKSKRPSRFEILFPLLKKGATKEQMREACLAADKKAGIVGRSKPDGTILGFMCHLRKGRAGAAFPGKWNVIVKGKGDEAKYKIQARKDNKDGETIKK